MYETITFVVDERIATITLNRPSSMNAFNQSMCDEFSDVWRRIRLDDNLHVVVLRAAPGPAFSTGVDVKKPLDYPTNAWSVTDPGRQLSPKLNGVWKPVVCAVHGMAAGGAFYWINEADIVICSTNAVFFDPHVSYGSTAALEPVGLRYRIPLGEVLRITLLGLDERLSAARALEIGLVSEVVGDDDLWARAHELASIIAEKPPAAVQGSVKAIWQSLDTTRSQALEMGMLYTQIGNALGRASVDRSTVKRPSWRLR